MSKQPPFDIKYPVRCKDGTPVTILTTEGRDPKYPIMGYVGDETEISMWAKDGKSQFGSWLGLVNIPDEGVVTIVTLTNGRIISFSGKDSTLDYEEDYGKSLVSVAHIPYSIMPGRRDDKMLEDIVAEFEEPKVEP